MKFICVINKTMNSICIKLQESRKIIPISRIKKYQRKISEYAR